LSGSSRCQAAHQIRGGTGARLPYFLINPVIGCQF
jgi:hypothetical protein